MGGLKPTDDLHSILFEHDDDCLGFGDLAFCITGELSMSHSSMRGMENWLYMKTIIHLLNILKVHFICSIKINTCTKQHSNTSMRKL